MKYRIAVQCNQTVEVDATNVEHAIDIAMAQVYKHPERSNYSLATQILSEEEEQTVVVG